MKVLKNHKASEIEDIIKSNIKSSTVVFTDKSTSYFNMTDLIDTHISEKSTKDTTKKLLKWVHIAISNAKRNLLGVYHRINGAYLQSYLDEFCYRLNRRYFYSIFERLVVACIFPYWQTND